MKLSSKRKIQKQQYKNCRRIVSNWLGHPDVTPTSPDLIGKEDTRLINEAFEKLNWPPSKQPQPGCNHTKIYRTKCFVKIALELPAVNQSTKRRKAKQQKPVDRTINFYNSFAWRKLRFTIIQKFGRRCLCCGQTPDDGIIINVDHIKPVKRYPELKLDPNNLQVLCNECNHGKGNWDETDFRPQM